MFMLVVPSAVDRLFSGFTRDPFKSDVLIDQLRAIDNRRLVEGPLTRLTPATMRRVEDAIRAVLDFPE